MAVEQLVLPTLIPMPIVEEPFCRVATDIVGLLHCSQKGHRYYILVVCDYATRYLKALPLQNTYLKSWLVCFPK